MLCSLKMNFEFCFIQKRETIHNEIRSFIQIVYRYETKINGKFVNFVHMSALYMTSMFGRIPEDSISSAYLSAYELVICVFDKAAPIENWNKPQCICFFLCYDVCLNLTSCQFMFQTRFRITSFI